MYILESNNPDEIVEARLVIKIMMKNADTRFVTANDVAFIDVVDVDIMNSESDEGQLLVISTNNNYSSLFFNPKQQKLTAWIGYDGVTALHIKVSDKAGVA